MQTNTRTRAGWGTGAPVIGPSSTTHLPRATFPAKRRPGQFPDNEIKQRLGRSHCPGSPPLGRE
eukprot:4205521-Alexandrium_andersonii.AAC.1